MGERLTQLEFAKLKTDKKRVVNKSTVCRWIKSGRITLGGDGLIDKDQALRQLEMTESPAPHHQAAKAQIDEAKAEAQEVPEMSQEPMTPVERIGLRLKMATMKEREAKAEMANIELDKAAGLLVERSEVDFMFADIGKTFAEKLCAIPDRYAPACAAHGGNNAAIHKELEDMVHDVLSDISEHLRRKAETI